MSVLSQESVIMSDCTIVLLMCLQVRLISFFPKCDLLAGKSEQSQVIPFKETLRIIRTLSSLGILKTFERLKSGRTIFVVSGYFMDVSRPNGPELSCGGDQPPQRNPVRAWYVPSDSNSLFRACKIVDGCFRQLERLVRR
jgi:hypothetical protein